MQMDGVIWSQNWQLIEPQFVEFWKLPPHIPENRELSYGRGERGGEGEMYGKSNMETYITICKINSQREFAVWLGKLKHVLKLMFRWCTSIRRYIMFMDSINQPLSWFINLLLLGLQNSYLLFYSLSFYLHLLLAGKHLKGPTFTHQLFD